MNRNPEVDAFLAAAPEDQRAVLKRLRALIRKSIPQARECFTNGMAVYTVGAARTWTAGFGSRKNCAMFYVMSSSHLDRFDAELGKRRTGKSCIAMAPAKALPLSQLEALAARILAELPG
jgi:uncharacterized protein YdhG (YjbR/CyaY superfamily)